MNPFGAILKLSKLLDLRFFPKIYDFLSEVSVSVSEIVSDPRPRVTRPAGAGHTTCGRGSLIMCRSETGMTQSGMAIPDMKIPHVAGFSWGCHVRNVRYVLCQCSSIE